LLHRLGPVAGLADQLDVVLGREYHLQPAAEQGVIVDDERADRVVDPGIGWRAAGRLGTGRCGAARVCGYRGISAHGASSLTCIHVFLLTTCLVPRVMPLC